MLLKTHVHTHTQAGQTTAPCQEATVQHYFCCSWGKESAITWVAVMLRNQGQILHTLLYSTTAETTDGVTHWPRLQQIVEYIINWSFLWITLENNMHYCIYRPLEEECWTKIAVYGLRILSRSTVQPDPREPREEVKTVMVKVPCDKHHFTTNHIKSKSRTC